jgi:hypothetical protein
VIVVSDGQLREEKLAEIEARWGAATPGPWLWAGNKPSRSLHLMRGRAWGGKAAA